MKTKLRIVSVYVVANIFVKRSTKALIEICSTYIDNTFEERGPASACRKKTVKENERENNNSLERYTITHTAVTNKHLHKTHSQLRVRMRVGKKERKRQRKSEIDSKTER